MEDRAEVVAAEVVSGKAVHREVVDLNSMVIWELGLEDDAVCLSL